MRRTGPAIYDSQGQRQKRPGNAGPGGAAGAAAPVSFAKAFRSETSPSIADAKAEVWNMSQMKEQEEQDDKEKEYDNDEDCKPTRMTGTMPTT